MKDDGTQFTEAIRRLIAGGPNSDAAAWRSFELGAQRVFKRTLRRFWPNMQVHDVDEVISTTLHKILKNGGLAQIPTHTEDAARSYLALAIQSVARDRHRSAQRATTALERLQTIVEADAAPRSDGADGEALDILDLLQVAAERGLRHEVLLARLRHQWNLSYEEIGIVLGVDDSADTIRKQVLQAVMRIREALS